MLWKEILFATTRLNRFVENYVIVRSV